MAANFKFGVNLPTFVMAKVMMLAPMGIFQLYAGMDRIIEKDKKQENTKLAQAYFVKYGIINNEYYKIYKL